MKFLRNLMPAKTLTLLQNLLCIVVMAALFFLSLGPIFTVKLESSADMRDEFNEMAEDMGLDSVEFPEEVEISATGLISSVGGVMEAVSAIGEMAQDATDAMDSANNLMDETSDMDDMSDVEDVEDAAADAEEDMAELESSMDNVSAAMSGLGGVLAIMLVVFEAFNQSFILGFVYMGLLGTVIAMPFVFGIKLVLSVLSFLKNLGKPFNAYPKMAKRIGEMFATVVGLMFLKVIVPEIEFAATVTTMIVICVVSFVINLVASRMKEFTPAQTTYQNVMQIFSIIGIGGFFAFFIGLNGTDLFNKIWARLGEVVGDTVVDAAVGSGEAAGNNMIAMVMIVVMIVLLFKAFDYLKQACCRMACMVPAGKLLTKDNYTIRALLALSVVAIPMYLMNSEYALELTEEGMAAFGMMTAGVIVMIAAELILAFTKRVVCRASNEDIQAVLTGHPTEEIAAPVEEAPAEEAPAEEENQAE